jgi:mRNA interferase MazF
MERGDLWWADLDGRRLVVLLSGEEATEFRAMQVVAPARTEIGGVAVEVEVGALGGLPEGGVLRVALARPGFIPCSWLLTLSRVDLIERAGALSPAKVDELDEALRLGGL